MAEPKRFRFLLPGGAGVVTGYVQGAGGLVTELAVLQRAQLRSESGRDPGIYEPRPGHAKVYRKLDALSGPHDAVCVPLAGAVITAFMPFKVRYYDPKKRGVQVATFCDADEAFAFADTHRLHTRPCEVEEQKP